MKKNYVSNSTESIRMFKSPFMEAMSKVHWTVPLFIYIPVVLYFSYKSLFVVGTPLWQFAIIFVGGLLLWSLVEYILHRFVFHFHPTSEFGKKIHFIFHGVHHDYPNDVKRLVMPPSVSIPLAFIFYGLFYLLLPTEMIYPAFAAFVLGYLFYDITHYGLHHFNFKNEFWKNLKKHHMLHHYSDADKGFGVSSKLWDKIFDSDFLKKKN